MTLVRVQPERGAAADRTRGRRWALLALLAVFALKFVVDLVLLPALNYRFGGLYGVGPADDYYTIAKNVWLGHGYRFTPDTALTLMREPGYPYLLAGLRSYFESGLQEAIVINLLCEFISALLVSHLSRFIFSNIWVQSLAPFLFVLHPGVMIAELRIGTEIPFTAALLCFLALTARAMRTGRTPDFLWAGLVLGLTSCIRSTALLFPAFLIIYQAFKDRSPRSMVRAAANIAVMFAAGLLVLTPWIIRNYALVGKFVPTASVQGIAMQVGQYICTHEDGRKSFGELDKEAAGVRNSLALAAGYHTRESYYPFFYDPRDEVEFNSLLSRNTVHEYVESPTMFARCAAENLFNFWFTGRTRISTLVNLAVQVPYLLLALAGLAICYRKADQATLACLLLFIIYTVGVYVPIHAQARYSVPLVPILAILGAVALGTIIERRRSRRHLEGAPEPT
jgi:Dolichyl-phosphate-mannose-protein mannosyltransferase